MRPCRRDDALNGERGSQGDEYRRAAASSSAVIVAGAGIGGLTAALAIARRGFRVLLCEQAQQVDEAGAGIQLSPNASRILIALGLEPRLREHVCAPAELCVHRARSGRVLARVPLGRTIATRYQAPYWVIHRGDLHMALMDAVRAESAIAVDLGQRVESFVVAPDGVSVRMTSSQGSPVTERGMLLIAADGLWSTLRQHLGHSCGPRFARHTAWRALIPAPERPPGHRTAMVNLWLGKNAHLVHYPVRQGNLVNVVAIVRDEWREAGWNAPGERSEILERFAAAAWHPRARAIVAAPHNWRKWALYDCAPFRPWGDGPVTLLGDAAHPMLPYLAQGAAAAIEDADVLARALSQMSGDPAPALRFYERERQRRTARIQRAARRNGRIYHLGGAAAFLRNVALLAMGGERILARHQWLYGWKAR